MVDAVEGFGGSYGDGYKEIVSFTQKISKIQAPQTRADKGLNAVYLN